MTTVEVARITNSNGDGVGAIWHRGLPRCLGRDTARTGRKLHVEEGVKASVGHHVAVAAVADDGQRQASCFLYPAVTAVCVVCSAAIGDVSSSRRRSRILESTCN